MIAIEWTKHGLTGLCADVAKSTVRVTRTFRFSWPRGIDPADQPQQAGTWLKSQFDRLGIRGRQVDVVLPREEVVVRRLQVPDASPRTLAAFRDRTLAMCCTAGLAGLPQISLPRIMVEGCPLGLSLVARPDGDEMLLQAAIELS